MDAAPPGALHSPPSLKLDTLALHVYRNMFEDTPTLPLFSLFSAIRTLHVTVNEVSYPGASIYGSSSPTLVPEARLSIRHLVVETCRGPGASELLSGPIDGSALESITVKYLVGEVNVMFVNDLLRTHGTRIKTFKVVFNKLFCIYAPRGYIYFMGSLFTRSLISATPVAPIGDVYLNFDLSNSKEVRTVHVAFRLHCSIMGVSSHQREGFWKTAISTFSRVVPGTLQDVCFRIQIEPDDAVLPSTAYNAASQSIDVLYDIQWNLLESILDTQPQLHRIDIQLVHDESWFSPAEMLLVEGKLSPKLRDVVRFFSSHEEDC